jgi:phosphatidate cytidylyltransferase
MITRIITALILAPVALGLTVYLSTFWFGIFVGAICVIGLYEWNRLTAKSLPALLGGILSIVVLTTYGHANLTWLGYLCIVVSLYWIFQIWDLYKNGLSRNLGALTGFAEGVFLLAGFWAGMIILHQQGSVVIIAAMATVWAADSFAYFAGKSLGRRPLAPTLSPKKTIEGVVGGLLGACLVLLLSAFLGFDPALQGSALGIWVFAGIMAAIVSVAGDLFQSRIKRRAGVKDSGSILPGHGGILDRIDGLIAAIPVFAWLWAMSGWQ